MEPTSKRVERDEETLRLIGAIWKTLRPAAREEIYTAVMLIADADINGPQGQRPKGRPAPVVARRRENRAGIRLVRSRTSS